jgi:uncharacterized membrane protein HdeD (DUF308 family)
MPSDPKTSSVIASGFDRLLHKWNRSTQLGMGLILLGSLALSTAKADSTTSVMLSGWLLILSGIGETVRAFQVRKSTGFFLHIVPGVASLPIGLLMATHPMGGTSGWTLLFASYFLIVGLLRAISASRLKFSSWLWVVGDGIITALLGVLLWPASSRFGGWIFSISVGISLVLRGWSSIKFGIGNRNHHFEPAYE